MVSDGITNSDYEVALIAACRCNERHNG